MRSFWASTVCIVLCLSLLVGPAAADDLKCKKAFINVREASSISFSPDCFFRGVDYGVCAEFPIHGTLEGTWVFYFTDFNNFVEVPFPMPTHSGFAAGWGVSEFKTRKGDVWTRDTWVIDLEDFVLLNFVFFTQNSFVEGGTGVYEGATGHLGYVGDETAGIMRGEVCTIR